MGRSRKMRGGAITPQELTQIATSAQGLANLLDKLASEVSSPNPVVDDPNAVQPENAVVVQPDQSNAATAVQSPNEASSPNAVVQPNAAGSAAADQPSNAAGSAAADQPSNAAGSAAADQPSNAAAAPSVPAAPESESLLTPNTPIPYGNGSITILYGKILTILTNMINNPNNNKKGISKERLQTLLTKIQSAKTVVEVSNILTANGIALVGAGSVVSKQYFSMNMTGGTKKRKRTKMTNRRKTRKMKKTRKMRKMRKMRKTMKI